METIKVTKVHFNNGAPFFVCDANEWNNLEARKDIVEFMGLPMDEVEKIETIDMPLSEYESIGEWEF